MILKLPRHDSAGDDGGMTEITITTDELAQYSAAAFSTPGGRDIPEKIWCDQFGGVPFIRAAWADGITPNRIGQLEELKTALEQNYQVEWVAVAYFADMSWRKIDRLAARLQAVR